MDSINELMKRNKTIVNWLDRTVQLNYNVLRDIKTKIRLTYWITLILYVLLFFLGFSFLCVPLYYASIGDIVTFNSLISGIAGIINFIVLLLLRPLDRIHNLMGDYSQILLINLSYQEQVALTIVATDINNKDSLICAAKDIEKFSEKSLELIEEYYEKKGKSKNEMG